MLDSHQMPPGLLLHVPGVLHTLDVYKLNLEYKIVHLCKVLSTEGPHKILPNQLIY